MEKSEKKKQKKQTEYENSDQSCLLYLAFWIKIGVLLHIHIGAYYF